MCVPEPAPVPNHLISGFHFRGKLPHLKREGAVYFVTFRLIDSLPRAGLLKLKQGREALMQHALAARRPLSWEEERRLFAWYSERVEGYLDRGVGACWLRRPEIGRLVSTALNFFNGERYDLHAWVVMPNHAHAVIWPRPGHSLSEIEHSWKSYTAKAANKILNRVGEPFWQKESYDHWIRDDEEHTRLCTYVINNPTKAGLCRWPQDWQWSSANPLVVQFQRGRDA
jgi:REP-associated tyrosine transposase